MAAPVLAVTRTPSGTVAPGTQITFAVTATSEARTVTYTFTGTDASSGATAVVNIPVENPVTITGAVSDPAGKATLVKGQGNTWTSTV